MASFTCRYWVLVGSNKATVRGEYKPGTSQLIWLFCPTMKRFCLKMILEHKESLKENREGGKVEFREVIDAPFLLMLLSVCDSDRQMGNLIP